MRTNLFLLCILLAAIAVGVTWTSPSRVQSEPAKRPAKVEWEVSWRGEVSFSLVEPNGFYNQWLDIENDRYRLCDSGCTEAGVRERGAIKLEGERLKLISDSGRCSEYTLLQRKGVWFLRDAKGVEHRQGLASVPRLHPLPAWLHQDRALQLDGIRPGMTRAEVKKLYPKARFDGGSLEVSPYAESSWRTVTIKMENDVASAVQGIRLTQGGRDLLNECSTRRDAENLLGPLKWAIIEWPSSHGTSAQAVYRKLLIRVHWLPGMSPEEAKISALSLER